MPDGLPRVGSALLVRDEANRILLGKRNKDPQRGRWVIPGGKIRPFETIGDAATRELREETGLEVEVERHFRVYEIINPPNEHRIVIYSWGRLIGGTPNPSDDLSEVRFFCLDELGYVPITPLVRQVLADAGLIPGESEPLEHRQTQLKFFFVPIKIVGGTEKTGGRSRSSQRTISRTKRRARQIDKSPLLFDSSLSCDS